MVGGARDLPFTSEDLRFVEVENNKHVTWRKQRGEGEGGYFLG